MCFYDAPLSKEIAMRAEGMLLTKNSVRALEMRLEVLSCVP